MKSKLLIGIVVIALVAGGWILLRRPAHAPTTNPTSQADQTTDSNPSQTTPASFDKTKFSLTDPTSLWVIVNKQHPLNPISYVPGDLVFPDVAQRVPGAQEMKMRKTAATALEKMFAAAKADNINLIISTAYRGYSYQSTLYNGYVKRDGQAAADKSSARPGYSEHQTGWALDIRARNGVCPIEQCFSNTPEGKWLAANAYKYGFLLRYPKDKVAVTGYEYEPWHFRYIGTYLSKEMHAQGVETMEEFFGVSGGTSYN